jgi:hypothetical protein
MTTYSADHLAKITKVARAELGMNTHILDKKTFNFVVDTVTKSVLKAAQSGYVKLSWSASYTVKIPEYMKEVQLSLEYDYLQLVLSKISPMFPDTRLFVSYTETRPSLVVDWSRTFGENDRESYDVHTILPDEEVTRHVDE